jgi:hypothetical protein
MAIFWANDTSITKIVIDFRKMCFDRHSRIIAEATALFHREARQKDGAN